MNTYRVGTTVITIDGPHIGVVGRVVAKGTANGSDYYDITTPFAPGLGPDGGARVFRANAAHVMKAPHPYGWYQQVQNHGGCSGCDDVWHAMSKRGETPMFAPYTR
jgi:hypothetical protein